MRPIRTQRLILRNWEERDRPLFRRVNSEERVMEYFPYRRDRAEADAVMDRMRTEAEADGFGWTGAEIAATGECIGIVGLHITDLTQIVGPDTMEIGWRLAPEFWGQGFVTEAATALLDFAFALGRKGVVALAVASNFRSLAVMERLGMRTDPAEQFDHPRVTDAHPHLKRHVVYRLSRKTWDARRSKNSAPAQ